MLATITKSLRSACGVALRNFQLFQSFPAAKVSKPSGAIKFPADTSVEARSFSVFTVPAKNSCGILSRNKERQPERLRHKHTDPISSRNNAISKKFVITAKDTSGKKIDSPHVVERFLRLGNGMWLRRVPGYRNQLWKKIIKKGGPQLVYRMRRHLICSNELAKMLDKLVTDDFKRQRWTVSDPYAGYDDHVKFHYNPWNVPGTNAGRDLERGQYMWRRYSDLLKMKQRNRRKHGRRGDSSNRQKPLPGKPYFH